MFGVFHQMLRTLLDIESALDRIQQKASIAMATLQNFKDLLAAINVETNRLAAKIQELIDKVTTSGLSGPEEAEILADLQAVKDRLSTVGADPSNPIPPVPTP